MPKEHRFSQSLTKDEIFHSLCFVTNEPSLLKKSHAKNVTTMLATSEKSYFQVITTLLTTGTYDTALWYHPWWIVACFVQWWPICKEIKWVIYKYHPFVQCMWCWLSYDQFTWCLSISKSHTHWIKQVGICQYVFIPNEHRFHQSLTKEYIYHSLCFYGQLTKKNMWCRVIMSWSIHMRNQSDTLYVWFANWWTIMLASYSGKLTWQSKWSDGDSFHFYRGMQAPNRQTCKSVVQQQKKKTFKKFAQ